MLGNIRITEYGVRVNLNLSEDFITAFLEFVLVSTCVFESIPTVNIKKIKW